MDIFCQETLKYINEKMQFLLSQQQNIEKINSIFLTKLLKYDNIEITTYIDLIKYINEYYLNSLILLTKLQQINMQYDDTSLTLYKLILNLDDLQKNDIINVIEEKINDKIQKNK